MKFAKLNFPTIKVRARERDGVISVWDPLRRCYIQLTPEEWVRQHLCSFLLSHLNILPQQIRLEYPVEINGQPQRADVVVLSNDGANSILVECKAPEVAISQSTFDQAVRYNSVVGARYLILTNGLRHHLYEYLPDEENYVPLKSFDDMALKM